jgi:hypothetical protein
MITQPPLKQNVPSLEAHRPPYQCVLIAYICFCREERSQSSYFLSYEATQKPLYPGEMGEAPQYGIGII